MRVYLTVTLRDGSQLLHNSDSEAEAIEWLKKEALPPRMEQVVHIQVERAQLNA